MVLDDWSDNNKEKYPDSVKNVDKYYKLKELTKTEELKTLYGQSNHIQKSQSQSCTSDSQGELSSD